MRELQMLGPWKECGNGHPLRTAADFVFDGRNWRFCRMCRNPKGRKSLDFTIMRRRK